MKHFVQKVATLNTVLSLTVNFIMDIFLQISQNFQNTAAFQTIFKSTFCKSEHMLS